MISSANNNNNTNSQNIDSSASSSSSASTYMASAFASVSEMASKTILAPKSTSSSLVEKNCEKNSSSALFRAFSLTKLKSTNSDSTSPQDSASILTDSLATASSVFNNLLNPFDSSLDSNSQTEAKPTTQSQKQKQNLFFKKFEAHSHSLSSAVFGYNILDNVNMLAQSNTRANSESSNPIPHSNNGSIKRKTKPPGTLEYQVEANDTIEKIALKWNTIPSEIQHLNRLATRVIFPGQIIFVPDPSYVPPPPPTSPPMSPHTKVQLPLSIINELNTLEPHQNQNSTNPITTSQTSNNHGFNIFKWKSTPAPKPGHVELQKQKNFSISESSLNSTSSSSNESKINNDKKNPPVTSRHTLTEEDAKKLDEECMQRFLKINCKIVTRSKGCFEGVLIVTPSALMFDPFDTSAASTNNHLERRNSTSASDIYDEASAIIPIEIISNVIMYEDLALKDVQEYFDYQHHIELIESDNFLVEHHLKESQKVDFHLSSENNESDDILVVNKDDVFEDEHSAKRKDSASSGSSKGSSLISCYLCIKVNKNKDFITCPLNRKMKNRLVSEFWFQINDTSTDKICAFFLEWKSDPTFSLNEEATPKGQFQLVKHDEKVADLIAENLHANTLSLQSNKSFSTTNRLINKGITSFVKDWEIVNLRELELKIKQEIEIEKEYKTLPNLNEPSTILKEEHLRKLNVNLIPRAVGYNWALTFSTDLNGFSLNTMYRLLADVESPCLIVVMDSNRNIFGAMSSCKLYQSEHYYGTGESFLYTFYPSFKIFKWTGENNFFIRGNAEGLGFGCAEGYHALWFDGDLLNGHSQRSKTFDNDMLSSTEYFTITAMEVWTFSD